VLDRIPHARHGREVHHGIKILFPDQVRHEIYVADISFDETE
jgi:hypothetical protein